jgi:phenylpropionate dioxygenase-like ring-hydroxylating dioxygenase large terminal subunit
MSWNNNLEFTAEEAKVFVTAIKKYVYGFEPLSQARFRAMRKDIDSKWTNDQILSSWRLLTTQHALRCYKNANTVPEPVLKRITYKNLLKFSKIYEVPPLALVSRALVAQEFSKTVTDKWIHQPNLITDADIHKLVITGWNHDSENPTATKLIFQKSQEYERQVERLLRSKGIAFKTQDQLVKEQTELYGRAIITPDFLLTEPIMVVVTHVDGTITERIIHWIDVKNYMFMGAGFITKGLLEQAAKYVKEFGEGAFMFHYGFVNSISISGTIMLASSETPVVQST